MRAALTPASLRSLLAVLSMLAASACTTDSTPSGSEDQQGPPPTAASDTSAGGSTGRSYVAFGDSWPYGAHCDGCTPFPVLYAAALDQQVPTDFTNLTTNGGTTASLLRDLQTSQPIRDTIADADVIVISTGGNDMAPAFEQWQRSDGCGPPEGIGCFRAVAGRWHSDMEAVLAEIDQLREGRPTAVRVLTMSNEFLADPGLIAMVGPDFGPEQGARIVAWQKQAFCRAAIRHHDLCVDLRPVLNGPTMDEPQDVNTQASMQQVADALLGAGLPELDKAEDTPAGSDPAGSDGSGRLVDIGSRELYLECYGAGRPVVVLEPGQGEPRSGFAAVQDLLAAETTVCTYDRANVGQSGSAPTPRTSADAVADLHALLARAEVPAPYVLAGTSAGGFIALHYARAHPEEVTGVLAMNPPPLARQWAARAYPLLTPAERADEAAFYSGDNPESFDWTTSSSQSEAVPTPRGVPMTLIHSSVAQCEGEIDGPCAKTAELYERLGAEYAAAWPGATYRVVDSPHAVHVAEPALVARMIEDLITGGPHS